MNRRVAVLVLAGGGFPVPSLCAQGKNSSAPPPRRGPEGRPAGNPPKPARAPQPGAGERSGQRALERLENMSPEQRERALGNLPPGRREELEQRLRVLDAMSPAERMRLRTQLERFNNLPPQKQNQIRRSMQQFQQLPEGRKALVKRELDRMISMSRKDRQSVMNGQDFRARFTPREQQMMQNLSEIMPENSGKRN